MAASARRSNRPRAADFTTPLTIPGGALAGAEVVRELAPEVALPVWQTLRSVLMWAAEEPALRDGLFEPCAMADWERQLLQETWEPDVRCPLAVLVGELSRPAAASLETVARACLCVTDWALERGHVATALAFAEAAALSWPQQPRFSWMAGRLLRAQGRLREAELYLKRAERAAVACQDYEGQIFALQSLGNLYQQQGTYQPAEKSLSNALRASKKHRVRERQGEILHDLLVVAYARGEMAEAEQYGREALEQYQGGHPRLAALAHDVAWIWMSRKQFARALPVLLALPPLFSEPRELITVLASVARAAGACGEQVIYAEHRDQAWTLVHASGSGEGVSAALVEIASGALALGEWEDAALALRHAINVASARGEQDTVVRAESLMEDIRERRTIREQWAIGRSGEDVLASAFLRTLKAVAVGAA